MRTPSKTSIAGKVRKRIEGEGAGRVWTFADFRPLSPTGVAAALSRMAKEGSICRIRKGVYCVPKKTRFGELMPEPARIAAAVLKSKGVEWKSSGLAAYNGLGLTTQVSPVTTFAVSERVYRIKTLPNARLNLRVRPRVAGMSDEERTALDALRELGRIPDSSPAEVAIRIKDSFATERLSFHRIARLALEEPPRVRALLGAIGSEIGADDKTLCTLRKSLNPLTSFHLGLGNALPNAGRWKIQ